MKKKTLIPETEEVFHSIQKQTQTQTKPKRKQAGNETSLNAETSSKRSKSEREVRRKHHIRYDNISHLPGMEKCVEATRCKYEGCKFRSHVFCMKCNVHLCLQPDRNCFQLFHSLL